MRMCSLCVALLALAAVAPAEEADPELVAKVRARYQSATTHYNLSEYREALADYTEAYRMRPDPVFLFNIAQSYRQLGEFEKAARFYRTYLREKPDAPNRAAVERFIADADAALARQQAERQPTAVAAPELKPTPAAAPEPSPAPPRQAEPPIAPVVAAPATESPPPVRSRAWLWGVAGAAGAIVVGTALGVGLGLGLSSGNGAPESRLGAMMAVFQ
jgi:tetratricopeptide (TPR) repeat protein